MLRYYLVQQEQSTKEPETFRMSVAHPSVVGLELHTCNIIELNEATFNILTMFPIIER